MTSEPLSLDSARFSKNHLLATLEPAELAMLIDGCSVEPLVPGNILHRPGQPVDRVYFPLSGTVSLVSLSTEGTMVEAATIGRDGTTGVPVFLAGDFGPLQVIAQVPGDALAVSADAFRSQLVPGSGLDGAMRRYTQAQMAQTAQTALCNRLHELEQRAARWLLQTLDRVEGSDVHLTHEFLSIMLGVQRPTVTLAIGALQTAGLVHQGRGHIEVLDRAGLEAASCECYRIITDEYVRLFA
ncbi:MAG TPA: Crp/Fnr family transcriptional regulator [Candidatus Limnocylindria bacterium]